MGSPKKSDDINRNYPMLGFRVARSEKNLFTKDFEALLTLLGGLPEYRRVKLKKNAVFIRALEIGLEQIKKKKSLG
jgi:hypothetical protein